MPIYEYRCDVCGCRFERIMGRDEKNPGCPGCGSAEVEKILSAPAGIRTAQCAAPEGPAFS